MIENSTAYQVWIFDQLEPDAKLRVGYKPKREKRFVKPEPREHETEAEMLKKEKEFLLKHGIDF